MRGQVLHAEIRVMFLERYRILEHTVQPLFLLRPFVKDQL